MFSSILKWVKKILNSILSFIKKILPYIMIALAIYFSLGLGSGLLAGVTFFGVPITGSIAAMLAMGVSFLFAPKETAAVIGRVTTALGTVASGILATVGSVASGALSGILKSPFGLAVIGVGLYVLLAGKKKGERDLVLIPNSGANNDNPK